jgi:drug/metabolite transporter (DMT)-like permease
MTTADAAPGPLRRFVPIALLLGLGTMWGASFSMAKIATTAGAHPLGLLLWQAGGGAVIVLAVGLARRRLRGLARRNLGYFATCCLMTIVVPSGAIYWAAPNLPAGILATLVATAPLITYGVAVVARREGFHPLRVAGIVLGFGAVILIVGPSGSLPAPGMAIWIALGMAAPIGYGLSNVYIAYCRPPATDSIALAAGTLVITALLVAPVVVATGTGFAVGPPWDRVDFAVLVLPTATGLAHVVLFELIRTAGPVFFSMVNYFTTASGVIWGMLLFGERHSPWIWAALVLMFGALTLVNTRPAARVIDDGRKP